MRQLATPFDQGFSNYFNLQSVHFESVYPSQYSLTAEDGVDLLERTDVHIHFPAGAVGKDGPSAGVTIVTVLVSLFRYIYLFVRLILLLGEETEVFVCFSSQRVVT